MSALGQKRTLRGVRSMSALPPKADIGEQLLLNESDPVVHASREAGVGAAVDKSFCP